MCPSVMYAASTRRLEAVSPEDPHPWACRPLHHCQELGPIDQDFCANTVTSFGMSL